MAESSGREAEAAAPPSTSEEAGAAASEVDARPEGAVQMEPPRPRSAAPRGLAPLSRPSSAGAHLQRPGTPGWAAYSAHSQERMARIPGWLAGPRPATAGPSSTSLPKMSGL